MKFILGKKIEMTQLWKGNEYVAVTKVQAGPCAVSQVKTNEKDGYSAVQIVFDTKKEKNINKPQIGHLKKAGLKEARYAREFRIEDNLEIKSGNIIKVDTFKEGDMINVSGVSKGKGFAGVVKRHGFSGSKKTHGNKDQLRMPGSAGATGPAHVFKGTRMGGRMGGDNVTTTNVEIAEVDLENNILFVKGAVPGARNSLVAIVGQGDLVISQAAQVAKEEKKTEIKDDTKEEVAEKLEETETVVKNAEEKPQTEQAQVESEATKSKATESKDEAESVSEEKPEENKESAPTEIVDDKIK